MSNMANNMQLVVNIAKEYTEQLTSSKVVELFEAYNCWHGIYFYLGARIAFTEVGQGRRASLSRMGWRTRYHCCKYLLLKVSRTALRHGA